MWILFKCCLLIGGFFFRLYRRAIFRRNGKEIEVNGVKVFAVESGGHNTYPGRTPRFTEFSIENKSKFIFKITRESYWDKIFKFLSLAQEVQTGDESFDESCFVASDCKAFHEEIKTHTKFRQLINRLFFHSDCEFISCDGATLRVKFSGNKGNDDTIKLLIAEAFNEISSINENLLRFTWDPFVIKIVIIESIIFSIAIYGLVSFFDGVAYAGTIHLDPLALAADGLKSGAIFGLMLSILIVFLMRGSSKGHRIIIELFILIAFFVPVAGVGFLRDINLALDVSIPLIVEDSVINLRKDSGSGYGRRHRRNLWIKKILNREHTYTLYLENSLKNADISIPRNLKINKTQFSQLKKGDKIRLEIGRGRLGYAHLKSITPI